MKKLNLWRGALRLWAAFSLLLAIAFGVNVANNYTACVLGKYPQDCLEYADLWQSLYTVAIVSGSILFLMILARWVKHGFSKENQD